MVNRLVTWGDTTGDTLTQASVKLDGTTFKNTSDVNLVVIDGTNAALGVGVLVNVTSGSENVAVGDKALNILTTGGTNTAVGTQSLATLLTGSNNVCVGNASGGNYTTSESYNICIGAFVSGTVRESNVIRIGRSDVHNNLYIGNRAMYKSIGGNCSFGSAPTATGTANSAFRSGVFAALITGASNTAVGWSAMPVATTGTYNSAFVRAALASLTTGSSNVVIGGGAGGSYTSSESNNVIIGMLVTGTVSESNKIRIGSMHDGAFIVGIRGVTTANADAIPVLVDSAGQLGTVSSSIRFKENIATLDTDESSLIDKLRPVTFNYIGQQKRSLGLIAEEVEEVYPEMCVYDSDELLTMDYSRLAIMLLREKEKANCGPAIGSRIGVSLI
jgi:hypothetical protein